MTAVTKYYQTNYTYPDVSTYLFDTEEEARAYVKSESEKELRYQTEENGFEFERSVFMIDRNSYRYAKVWQDKHYGDGMFIEWFVNPVIDNRR